MAARRARRGFGKIRQLPSGRYQASYTGPDLQRHNADTTFSHRADAEEWLGGVRKHIAAGTWAAQQVEYRKLAAPVLTFDVYATSWLAERDLKPRTRALYASLLRRLILPDLGHLELAAVTPAAVRAWYAGLDPDSPTQRSHAYALLRSILTTAVEDELMAANPCRIKGAGQAKRAGTTTLATPAEIEVILAAMPERLRPMVLLATWCSLRFGELTELRRGDVDLDAGVLHVRRAVVWTEGDFIVGDPKSDAGIRTVHVPPHLVPVLREALPIFGGPDALLFPSAGDPSEHLQSATFSKQWRKARAVAGRPDLRPHDLRHTGGTLPAQAGATLAELMSRLGHSTMNAAMRYQHAAAGRDQAIAAQMSAMVAAK